MATPSNHGPSPSRRRFLTQSGVAAAGLALGPSFLAACGDDSSSSSSTVPGAKSTLGTGDKKLLHSNWTSYIDPESVALFKSQTGIDLTYTEDYNDNNEYFAKIRPVLSKGNPIDPDIITPTFWMAGRLATLGWLEELPWDQLPNAKKNLAEQFRNTAIDPDGKFLLPWQSGLTVVAYNTKTTGRELGSLDDLWDPAFKGKIGVLTEMRDTIGLIALAEGKDLGKPVFDDFASAFDKLEAQVKNGQIRRFTGNEYLEDLQSGNFAACIAWSGDIAQLTQTNPEVKYFIPESGSTLWYDAMVLPKGAPNGVAAAKWMDWVYDPVNAARIAATVQYISPVKGVQEELQKMGGDAAALTESEILFPSEDMVKKLHSWGPLSEDEEKKFDERFSAIQGS